MTGASVVGVAVGDDGAVNLAVGVDIEVAWHAIQAFGPHLQPLVGMVFKSAQTWCHAPNLNRRAAVSLIQSGVVRVFEKWALGIHHGPANSVLVTGMNGEVAVLDANLVEQCRWTAHEGSVNVLRVVDGQVWTGGGDGLVKCWDWDTLEPVATFAGPKKPVTSLFFEGALVIAQSHDRAVFVWDRGAPDDTPSKIAKIAALARTEAGWFACPKTGSKAGDIGSLARFDLVSGSFGDDVFDDGFGAWSLVAVSGRGLLAFGLDLAACWLDVSAARRTPIPWHSKSGPPHFLAIKDGSDVFFGDGKIYHNAGEQPGPIKGLYCAIQLADNRIAISGADGQVWLFKTP